MEINGEEILYGGDYNPDQWGEAEFEEDLRQMKVHRVNTATLPVFSWAKLQPGEDTFDFEWLDTILDRLQENRIRVIMATPTAAQPAWMSKKYPDILPVMKNGMKRKHGGRTNFCPNSPHYRRLSRNIADEMARRYKGHPAIILWHINNEYGTYCYCDHCARAFRSWLQERYGTLEALNDAWYTSFWGHTFYEWDEIEPVSDLTELLPGRLGDRDGTNFQTMAVDYNRFMSDSLLDCFRNEADVIREHTPNIPITTNLMGTFKPLDYFKWAKEMDVVSWDNYPTNKDPASHIALCHDLMRGLKDGQPFLLMEQTPNQQNWQDVNALKRPGVMRLLSYQTIAHGGDAILFFQWRQSRGACEKFHAAMVPHAGHENTRMGRELTQLGQELTRLSPVIGSRVRARAAIVFDWCNWWAVEYSSGPSIHLKYVEQVERYYQAFYNNHLPVDVVRPTADLSAYDLVAAPVLYMVNDETADNLKAFVRKGGTLITTFFSGIVDEQDQVRLGGYPGAFRDLLGIWVEETDALFPDMTNTICIKEAKGALQGSYNCGLICDVVHAETAQVRATFGQDYYAGQPAITENRSGEGKAVYVASDPETAGLQALIRDYSEEKGMVPLIKASENVEATERVQGETTFLFLLNHGDRDENVVLPQGLYRDMLSDQEWEHDVVMAPKDVRILQKI